MYQTVQNQLVSWSDLKPQFSKQAKKLIKKHFLIKFRNISSILEIIISFFLILINLISYYFTEYKIENNDHPEQTKLSNQTLINWFTTGTDRVLAVCAPNKSLMHYLIGNTSLLDIAFQGGQIPNTNISFPGTIFSYKNTFSQLKSEMFLTRFNAVGIFWENIDDDDSLTNPIIIQISIQTVLDDPTVDLYIQIRDSLVKMRNIIENPGLNQSEIYKKSIILNTKISTSPFAHPTISGRTNVYSFGYAIIAAVALVVATIPDIETYLEEKENFVFVFSLLMGMSDTAFWFTNFIVSFVICLIIYIFISLFLCFWAGMNGNSFSMILVVSILYIIAELWFQYFLSTFINSIKNGRGLLVGLIMASTATAFVFQFAILTNDSNVSKIVIYIFSFFPMSAYELFVIQGSFASSMNTIPTYKWNNMNDSRYVCKSWIPIVWLIMDFIIYFLLFLILNAFLPRKYGTPPLNFYKFFKCKKFLKKQEISSCDDIEDNDIIEVKNVSKKFSGRYDIMALDDVSVNIKKGEMIIIIGPNGSGKSTFINCLSKTIVPSSGKIKIFNQSNYRNIGICYQKNVIIKSLTVKEHFELFGSYKGIPDDILEKSIDYFVEKLNLFNVMNRKAGNLSGGQKRKLCIALSLLGNPSVVLMDEPTAGVDVQGRMIIWKMISDLKDTTSIITSHELEEAEILLSRLFIMSNGKISFNGTSTELRKENNCGYILRIDSKCDVNSVLKLAQSFIPNSEISEDRDDIIRLPSNKNISKFLKSLEQKKKDLGLNSYKISVEQFEDVLSNIVNNT